MIADETDDSQQWQPVLTGFINLSYYPSLTFCSHDLSRRVSRPQPRAMERDIVTQIMISHVSSTIISSPIPKDAK